MSQVGDSVEALLNPMQRPRIGKVVVNMSVGRSGEPLQRAMRVLEQLSGQRPCVRKAKKTIRDWGISRKEPIACIVTLRGQRALSFLRRAFEAVGNRLPVSHFDRQGNFSFGVNEHIEMPGTRYDPELGIFGFDVCVSIEKPGYRVKRRRRMRSKAGRPQRVTPEEAVEYVEETFGVRVVRG